MSKNLKLDKALKKQDKKKENKPVILSGELGIPISGTKTVEVPNRRGYVFVRIHGNMSELIQAYNASVSPIYDLPVLITRQGSVYKVIGRDFDRYQENWGSVPYLPRHGTQHSFNPALNMGADATWVYPQQFMPLLAYPSGTDSYGSMHLVINPDFYSWQGNYKYAQTTGTPSFAPYLPTITGSAVMTLLYLQPSDNSLQIIAGSPFSNQITGSAQLAQYIPDIDRSVGIPLAAVRLVTGTTGITWNNIYDVRDFFTIGGGSSVGGGLGFIAQDEGILLGTGTTINFVGSNVDTSISGSVVRVFVTGSLPSTEFIQDIAGGMFTGSTQIGITATYNDPLGRIDLTISDPYILTLVSGSFIPSHGWNRRQDTLSFLLADSPSYVMVIEDTSITGSIGVGNKIWLTQSGQDKYSFVTAVGITGSFCYLTLYGGTDYPVTSGVGFSSGFSVSKVKSPFGFPTSPSKWTVSFLSTASASVSSPTADVWHTPGSLSFSAPIGLWNVYSAMSFAIIHNVASVSNLGGRCSISSASGSASYPQLTREILATMPISATATLRSTAQVQGELITLPSKTILYLIALSSQSVTSLTFRGDLGGLSTKVDLVCAYL